MTVKNINVERVSVLPGTLVADTIYVVKADGSSNAVIYVTNNDGTIAATPVTADADVAVDILAATGKTTPVDADLIGIVDSAASNVLKKLTFANLWVWAQAKIVAAYNPREVLTANRTYYVRTDGSDSNDGLTNTSGGAFLTYAAAIAKFGSIDFGGKTVTISIQSATWSDQLSVGTWVGGGSLVVDFNGGTLSTAGKAVNITGFLHEGFKIQNVTITTSSAQGVYHQGSGQFQIGAGVTFGSCSGAQLVCDGKSAKIVALSNYTITGGGATHWTCLLGEIRVILKTITITGTPAFTNFCYYTAGAVVYAYSNTFSGSATGTRYSGSYNGVCNVNGGGATYLPGSTAGVTTTGAQYA